MFEELVGLIDKIKDDSIGEWIVDKENDGTLEHPMQMPFVVYSSVVRLFEQAVYGFENGSIEKWLCRLKEIEESGEHFVSKPMSNIELINGSCTDQDVDVVVNAANNGLWAGGGICGVIFKKAGMVELTNACKKHKTPLNDGDAVITPAFNLKNAKAIIHAVGPNFRNTPHAFKELFNAYYNSLVVMKENGYHSISFPLISAGIFGGSLDNPAAESTKQCCRAYKKFREDYPMYAVDVKLCAFSSNEMVEAQKEFEKHCMEKY